MWNKIVNPETGRKVSIYGKIGQNIIFKYIQTGGHSGPCAINTSTGRCSKNDVGDDNCEVNKKSGRCKKIKKIKKKAVKKVTQEIAKVFSLDLTNGGEIQLEKIEWRDDETDEEESLRVETNYKLEDEFEERKKRNKNLDKILSIAKEGDLIEDLSEYIHRGLEGVYILKRSLINDKLEVVDLDPFDFWRGEGGVGNGFSIGPEYPLGYWNKAKFTRAYWPNPGDDFGMPQPVNKEILLKLNLVDLTERKLSSMIISSVNFNWGTLEFIGGKKEVIAKIKNIEFIDDNAYFMEDIDRQGTARIVDWQW
jgi:hypothetical protein